MSGIGSSGKPGTPPIGHGPSAITRTIHPRDDKKGKKKKNQDEQSMDSKEGHDEFAVRVDASLFHLKSGDIIEGCVVGHDGEDRLILDSSEGHFHLAGRVNLQPDDKATIRVIKSNITIEGVVIAAAGIQLSMPIHVVITPMDIHGGELSHETKTPDDDIKANPTYHPQKTPSKSALVEPQEDKAFVMSKTTFGVHNSDQVHSPTVKSTPPLAYQDLRTIIEASATPPKESKPDVVKPATKGHDKRPSMTKLLEIFEQEHPDISNDLRITFFGQNGLVPNGLAFFLAGLIFPDTQAWLGFETSSRYKDHPALKALDSDFMALHENINCLANENWRLVVLPYPEGDANRAIKIISNIQTGHGQDGSVVDMRTIVSQLNFVEPLNGGKALGKLQIEAIFMPNDHTLTLRFSNELHEDIRRDIELLTMLYFAKSHIKGHILFAPLSAGNIDFNEIITGLKFEETPSSIST